MATSYPRRDSASGLWRLSDITSNKLTEGTWPSSASTRGLSAGGNTPSKLEEIEYVTIASTGNATEFGDTAATNIGGNSLGGASASHGGIA